MPFLSIAEQIALGRKHGFSDDELPDWCAVIMTESGGWTDRVQGRPPGDYRPLSNRHGRGLVQIDLGQHPHVTEEEAFDPDFSADFARRLSRNRSGLGPTNWYGPRDHPEAAEEARAQARAILAQEAPMQGWMPGAVHTPPHNRSGLTWRPGTAWKLVLHTTESGYRRNGGGRSNYHGHQSYPHAEISEDAIEQYLPLSVGAYALAGSTDRWGAGNAAHAIQVELVWQAGNAPDASEDIQRNLARWLTFVRQETGMEPNVAPQGLPRRVSQDNWFDVEEWYEFEGICGHGNVPGNFDRWDPGPWPVDYVIDLSNAEMGDQPQQEDDMALPMFGDSPEGRPYAFWMIDGAFKKKLHTSGVWDEYQDLAKRTGTPAPKHVGKIPLALFDALIDLDELAKRMPGGG